MSVLIKTLNYNAPLITCRGQMSNIDENCRFAIPNPISLISIHVPSSVKIYLNYRPEKKIWACLEQITPSKYDKICPLAIPNLIFTILMHIPSLVKIHCCLLKLSYGNDIRMDGCTTDGRTDTRTSNLNHNIPPLSCGMV